VVEQPGKAANDGKQNDYFDNLEHDESRQAAR
jgi:hypothetical protein